MTMVVVTLVLMAMLLEYRLLTELQKRHALGLDKRNLDRIRRQRLEGLVKPRRQHRPDPEHDIRRLQGPRLARTHGIAMRRHPLRHQQRRRPHPVHDLRHKGLHRGNIRHNRRSLCHRGPRQPHCGHAAQNPSPHSSLL